MNESSFSLLNQKEIDTLVRFLSEKQVSREVLSQDSIDKLIRLIKHNDINRVTLDSIGLPSEPAFDLLKELHVREDSSEVCELLFEVDENTKYVNLTAKNTVTGTEYKIEPSTLDRLELVEGISTWGYSIPPILFDKIARIFSLRYSRKTYDAICSLYAVHNFGTKVHKLPSIYYPTSNQILDNLL